MGTNFNRTNKIKTYLNNFNFESINYPLKKKIYEAFENNNEATSLNIL